MKYILTRSYTDLTGRKRKLTFIRPSMFVHWSQCHPACMSSLWRDTETLDILQVPDLAWSALKMPFEDKYEVEKCDHDHLEYLRGSEGP